MATSTVRRKGRTWAARIRADRARRLVTWSEYAALVGISEAALYAILSGHQQPSELTQLKLELVLCSDVASK